MASFGIDASMTSWIVGGICGVATLVLSVISSSVLVGIRFGRLENDVSHMKEDLNEIKAMFKLTLK